MLIYLDNTSNRKKGPNENLARELLELFTLGEGHYTELDVKEAARALSGAGVDDTMHYRFKATQHDDNTKHILGVTRNHSPTSLVDTILAQPQTATFLCTKLWLNFVSDTPDPDTLKKMANTLRHSNYELKPTLELMLRSDAFWDLKNRAQLIKSPAVFITDTLRALQMPAINEASAIRALKAMGQEFFNPPNVKGWPGGTQWINADALLSRTNFLRAVLHDPDRLYAVADKEKMSGTTPRNDTPSTYLANMPLYAGETMEHITATILSTTASRLYAGKGSRDKEINRLFLEPAWNLH